ncbi:MAG: hypothetical protein M4579_000929 [Chaenotheca gracillima]|nr:MAG: hypothetical protein M4579_000929 [Chaenotheca gracillima]
MKLSAIILAAVAVLDVGVEATADNSQNLLCCTLLQHFFPDKTSFPKDAAYKTSISSYWSLQAQLNPSCIIQPECSKEVADIVVLLAASSLATPCPFAIRSGGHNPFPDNNIGAPGVTIDLSKINSVALKDNNSTAAIGPGARWKDVYNYLGPRGYSVPGGRAASVGVGGLTLGGGNSFFAARYGFVCDNVVNYEIVTGLGLTLNVNNHTNTDLFRALKGGANNFGIVTRFDITAFESDDIWGGIVLYPASTIPQQISAFVKFTDNIDKDPYGSLITFWAYSSLTGTTTVENAYEYTKPQAYPPAFKELTAIKPEILNTLRIDNLTSLTTELEAAYNQRDLFATLTFGNNADVIKEVYSISQKLLEPVKHVQNLTWITMFQPIPRVITDRGLERGGNSLGLDRTKSNQVLFLFFVQWVNKADDAKLQKAADTLMAEVTALTKKKGVFNEYIYLNYALADQDPIGSYGAENVKKLRAVSKKYDPLQIFQNLVPGGFKLGKANGGK